MLEVEISQIVAYPTSLRFGCVVRYGKDGPVRFASAYVTDETLSQDVLIDILDWAGKALNRALDQERDESADVDAPLF